MRVAKVFTRDFAFKFIMANADRVFEIMRIKGNYFFDRDKQQKRGSVPEIGESVK